MMSFIKCKDGRSILMPDGARIDRRAPRRASATDEACRLPNNVDAILAIQPDDRVRRRTRQRAWGY
jgi:hypothetical protein